MGSNPQTSWPASMERLSVPRLLLRYRLLLLAGVCLSSLGSIHAQVDFGNSPVGQPVTLNVTLSLQASGTLGTIEVLTLGTPNADYTAASSGSTCTVNAAYTTAQSCVVAVTFTPLYPGVRSGAVVLLDPDGAVLATTYLAGTGTGAVGVLVPGQMTTYAGNGQWVSVGDGGSAVSAELYLPAAVAIDGAGNLYIADSAHNRIREVNAASATIATVAGNGDAGYSGDNAAAIHAALDGPHGVAIDGAGNLYIADTGNNVIRKIVGGIITTVAGDGNQGYSGDGAPATLASLASPSGITLDDAGAMYIADTANHRIRKVDPSTGNISTIAGNGLTTAAGEGSYSGDGGPATTAGLNFPYAVSFDAGGNLYIPDSGNQRIRMVSANHGQIATVAGDGVQGFSGDGGAATAAHLNSPSGVAFDAAGNLYIADTQNNRIRKQSAATSLISTVAGSATGKFSGDGGDAAAAGLFGPYGVLVDPLGNLFVADYFDHRIRKISSNVARLTYPTSVRVGQVSAPQSQVVENDGNAALTFAAITPDANAVVDPASTTCSHATPLAADSDCTVGVDFAPAVVGSTVTGNVSLAGVFLNAPLDIQASGTALSLNSTTVSLASSLNPIVYAQTLSLVATVASGIGAPTGDITFADGANAITPPIALDASATAVYQWPAPTVGLHSLTASYSGDAQHLPSASAVLAQQVNEATATSLTTSQNPSLQSAEITFTANIASRGGGVLPSGEVAFNDGSASLGSGTLDAQGNASFSTTSLAPGARSITAAYAGNASTSVLGSLSSALTQQINASTSTRIASAADPSIYGSPVLLTATVDSTSGPASLAGSVNFFDQTTPIGSAFLVSQGGPSPDFLASLSISTLSVGPHAISAVYAGDSDALGSTSTSLAQTVEAAPTAVTVTATPNPSVAASPVLFTAKVSGGSVAGNVIFLIDNAALATQPLNASGFATFSTSTLAVGQHLLAANYPGTQNNAPSTSTSVAFAVQPIPTTTSLTLSASAGAGAQRLLTATVSGTSGPVPGGIVSFQSGSTILGAATLNTAGVATLTVTLNPGVGNVSARYPGDLLHAPSSSAPVAVSILALGFQIQLKPASLTLASSQNAEVNLSLVSNANFTDEIGLGCATLPPLVTCHFSSDNVSLAANAQAAVTLTIDTNSPLSGGTLANSTSPAASTTTTAMALAGALWPVSAFFILLLRARTRPRELRRLPLAAACTVIPILCLGCGAISQNSAAPGTYVIQVVGAGHNTGITQAVNLSVTVTR